MVPDEGQQIPMVIGGSNTMAGIFEVLIKRDKYFKGELISVSSEEMKTMAAHGAILVAQERGLCQ